MSQSGNDFGETLRRALSVAGRVEPADDGLERIRARVRARTPRPRLAAAAAAAFPWSVYRLLQYRTMAVDVLRQLLAAFSAAWRALERWLSRNTTVATRELRLAGTAARQPRHAAEHDPLPSQIGWIRPALAAASVAFAATLAMTVPPVRQAIVQLGSSVMSTGQTQAGAGGTAADHGSTALMNSPSQQVTELRSPVLRRSVTPSPSCEPAAHPASSGVATPGASATSTANATPTASVQPTAPRSATACATTTPTTSASPAFPPSSPTAPAGSPTIFATSPPASTAPATTPAQTDPPGVASTPTLQPTATPPP